MSYPSQKPKLLYIQYAYDGNLPRFLILHALEQVSCLRHFFDVTIVRQDCNYERICEIYAPDMVLIESGVNHATCRRPRVTNKRACPHIPKAALHHADAFCNARAGLLCDLEEWDIDTIFAISTTAGEHNPVLRDKLLYWPVFVDPAVYRDYGQRKSIDLLVTGNANAFYPWRRTVIPQLARRFPSYVCPHPGYSPVGNVPNLLVGESYARLLNISRFVPACGTVAGEAVRKHFEVPACMSCLVTQRTPALEAAGFEDLINCIFVEENNAVEKIDSLLKRPEVLADIVRKGSELVNARHTLYARGQILAWYLLRHRQAAGDRIVQLNPYDMPILVRPRSEIDTLHVQSPGEHLKLLRTAYDSLKIGDAEAADTAFEDCMERMPWMPEPRLGRAVCALHKGHPARAWQYIAELIRFELDDYRAAEPDPVEWSYAIITMMCVGAWGRAALLAKRFPGLRHEHLNMTRWLSDSFLGYTAQVPSSISIHSRSSVHALYRGKEAWVKEVGVMLSNCGQQAAAQWLCCDRRHPTDCNSPLLKRSPIREGRAVFMHFKTWVSARGISMARLISYDARRRSMSALRRSQISNAYRFYRGVGWDGDCDSVLEVITRWAGGRNASCEFIGALPNSGLAAALTKEPRPRWAVSLTLKQVARSICRPPRKLGTSVRWVNIACCELRRKEALLPCDPPLSVMIVDASSILSKYAKDVVDHVESADAVMVLTTDSSAGFLIRHALLSSSKFSLEATSAQRDSWAFLAQDISLADRSRTDMNMQTSARWVN